MPLIAPDSLLEVRLRTALAAVAKNPDTLDEPLANFRAQGAEDIKSFFRGRTIPILGGWPQLGQEVPCVTVQLRPAQENPNLQPINPTMWGYQGTNEILMYSSFWESSVMCTCYGNTQREATYLALVVAWLLLVMRRQLEIEGLMEQRLVISDFEPVPAMFDPETPWFLRTVTLSSIHQNTISLMEGPLIAEILVTPQDDNSPSS